MYNSAGVSRSATLLDAQMSSEQALLREVTAQFVNEACPLPTLRALRGVATTMPEGYWRRGAELGWFSMLVPEEWGGGNVSGDGVIDAAIHAEVRGARVQPGPFIPTNIVAFALAHNGARQHREQVLPALIAGERIASWAHPAPIGRGTVTANPCDGGHALRGVTGVVQDPDVADWFLLDVDAEGASRQVLLSAYAEGVEVRRLESLDFCLQMGRLELDGVQITDADFVGTAASTPADLSSQLDIAAVLNVAETVGAMDTLFEMTVRYAADRVAFGRPIGSFQAVKHQLADLSLTLEMAKASVQAAATAVGTAVTHGHTDSHAAMITSVAKSFVGDASMQMSQGCFQVFGGIGFTWEHDLHLYLRRAAVNEVLYGTPTWHRDRIVTLGLR